VTTLWQRYIDAFADTTRHWGGLDASAAGLGIYLRLGFEPVGPLVMFSRRQ
jgi:hypothetical protein